METIKIVFTPVLPNDQELLMASLLESTDINGFEQNEDSLIAYVNANDFEDLKIAATTKVPFTFTMLKAQNWNAVWESNFEPVEVPSFCGIRANFHQPFKNVLYEIIITPKMSFGTGHHATTYQVIEAMQKIDFANKNVCDYGTGTGVLAILAEKLGAANIDAIDNDDWSIENTIENIHVNNAQNIKVIKENTIIETGYDVVLANINKNILLNNMDIIAKSVKIDGTLIFSGVLDTDETDMKQSFAENGLIVTSISCKNNWLCIVTKRSS